MRVVWEILKITAVWIGILLAAAFIFEGALRLGNRDINPLAEISQKNQGQLFVPHSSLHSVSSVPGEFDYTAGINRWGYRGPDFENPKPSGVRRVFVIGDSFTFGVGSPDDQTIPALLQRGLGARERSIEVVNAGIGGTSPVTHYVNLRDIHLRYQPDAVVLMLDMTDLWDDWNSDRHALRGKDGDIAGFDATRVNGRRDLWVTMTYYSFFCRYINNKVVRTIHKVQVLGVDGYIKAVRDGKRAKAVIATAADGNVRESSIEYDGLVFMRGRGKEAMIREHWARTAAYILKIRDMLAYRNIPMVLVFYPHGIYVDGNQWQEGRKTWGFDAGKRYDDYLPFEIVEDFARKNSIPYVNTLGAFLRAPAVQYFFTWDGHLTCAGNRIVSEALLSDSVFLNVVLSAKGDSATQ
ncbi:MAG: GDSL-type esterase/lipase family protein [Candidatus Omnitrophota bacterium]